MADQSSGLQVGLTDGVLKGDFVIYLNVNGSYMTNQQ